MNGLLRKSALSALAAATLLIGCAAAVAPTLPPALAELDRRVREDFWDPKLKGVDWNAAAARAASEIAARNAGRAGRATTVSWPAGTRTRFECRRPVAGREWGTAGLAWQDGDGYEQGVLPEARGARG